MLQILDDAPARFREFLSRRPHLAKRVAQLVFAKHACGISPVFAFWVVNVVAMLVERGFQAHVGCLALQEVPADFVLDA